jgi:hypothetical protein
MQKARSAAGEVHKAAHSALCVVFRCITDLFH